MLIIVKVIKAFFWLIVFLFGAIALFLFLGRIGVVDAAITQYKIHQLRKTVDFDKLPNGVSHYHKDTLYAEYFLYKGELPSPQKGKYYYIRNNCDTYQKGENIPHYFTVCTNEGVPLKSVFDTKEIKKLSNDVYYVYGWVHYVHQLNISKTAYYIEEVYPLQFNK